MAVNYGLGGFESGFAFAAELAITTITIPIATQNEFVTITNGKINNVILGNGAAGIFSNNYHQIDFVEEGKLLVKSSGVYLVNYNITTSDPSNKTVALRIVKYTDRTNVIGGVQSGYCRSGDQFEIGSNCLSYIESGNKIYTEIANTDGTQDIGITSLNISLIKLNYSGKLNS